VADDVDPATGLSDGVRIPDVRLDKVKVTGKVFQAIGVAATIVVKHTHVLAALDQAAN
jgi:hypothetical protein